MTTSNTQSQTTGTRPTNATAAQQKATTPATSGAQGAQVKSATPVSTVASSSSTNSVTITKTQSTIQSPIGTLILTTTLDGDTGSQATTSTTAATNTVSKSNSSTDSSSNTETASPAARGVKRPAASAPKPNISKSTLFEHQLKTDQSGALAPDCKWVQLIPSFLKFTAQHH